MQARQSEDMNSATRCAHTLKGVAGNIGAISIQEAAASLEQACKEEGSEQRIATQLNLVQAALEVVLTGMEFLEKHAFIQTDQNCILFGDTNRFAQFCTFLRGYLNNDFRNVFGFFQSHIFPSLPTIGRLINTISITYRTLVVVFPCSDPNG